MSRIRTYKTYTEVTNGLFIDISDEEFTFLPIDPSIETREEEVRRASNE